MAYFKYQEEELESGMQTYFRRQETLSDDMIPYFIVFCHQKSAYH
jgi:hypothetical protein